MKKSGLSFQQQQYKQRAKWVMNIGSKPDLPDGTLVKAVFDEGSQLCMTTHIFI